MNQEFNHKHYNYKWTKGFLLFIIITCILIFSAVYAQVSVTGNLNDNNWSNGYPVTSLTCWKEGDYNCSPGTPYVSPDGTINFSYNYTELYQAKSITKALPNSGTGLMVSGFNFGWTSKNGNHWDDARQDQLSAYVQMYSQTGKWIEAQSYDLNFVHNWTTFNWTGNFTQERRGSDLGTILFGFAGKDNNNFMGPYGPEIINVSFQLRYQPDPCVVNPLHSPTCPKFNEALSNLSTPSLVVTSAVNTVATATSNETTSVINLVADPTKTSVNVTTTMNEIIPSGIDFSRTTSPAKQSTIDFALSSAKLQRENAEAFALSLRNSAPQKQTTITNQSISTNDVLDIISRNRRQDQLLTNQTNRPQTMLPNISLNSSTQQQNIEIIQPTMVVNNTSTSNNGNQLVTNSYTNNSRETFGTVNDAVSVPNQIISQTIQQSNNAFVEVESTQGSNTESNQEQVQVTTIQISQPIETMTTPVVIVRQEPQSEVVLPVVVQPEFIVQQVQQQTLETQSIPTVIVNIEEQKIDTPKYGIIATNIDNSQNNSTIEIELPTLVLPNIEFPKVATPEVPQLIPPQPVQVATQSFITTSISLDIPIETKEETIAIPTFVLPKLDAMNVVLEQPKQETYTMLPPSVFAEQEVKVDIEQTIQVASIPVVALTTTIVEQTTNNIDNVQVKTELINSIPVTQLESVSIASNFTTDRTNPINELIQNKSTLENDRKEPINTSVVNKNIRDNDIAGNVSIASIATQPTGFNQYTNLVLRDVAFYAPKEIYRGQRNVDNARVLRQLASDRLHQEMVNQQYGR